MANPTKVPFVDLVKPHKELKSELLAVVTQAFSTAGFIGGPMVEGFEREFAKFCETKYCVGVNSGTDALRFAFIAAGIGQDDIVITVPTLLSPRRRRSLRRARRLPSWISTNRPTRWTPKTEELSGIAVRS